MFQALRSGSEVISNLSEKQGGKKTLKLFHHLIMPAHYL